MYWLKKRQMQDRVTYEYTVIRLVPKVEREEFINMGVILFSKRKQFLDMKYHIDDKRIRDFSSDVDTRLIRKHMEAWALICKGGETAGRIGALDIALRFRWLSAAKSTIIQCSKTHPGICGEPAKVLEQLFGMYVL